MFSIFAQSNGEILRSDSLLSLIESERDDTNKVNHLNELGWEFMFQNPDTAILIFEQALGLASTISNNSLSTDQALLKMAADKGVAQAYNNLGNCYNINGDYSQSLSHHFKSLEIRISLKDKIGVSASLGNIGNVYYRLEEYSLALEYHFRALALSEEVGNKAGIAADLSNIGDGYANLLDYDTALKYYLRALKMDEEIGNKSGMSINIGNIGNIYYFSGDYPQALNYNLKALKLEEELGNSYNIAGWLGNIGAIYFQQKKYAEAEDYFLRGLKTAEEINALILIEEINADLSTLYAETNHYKLAYEHYKAYSIAKDSLFNDDKSKEIGRLEAKHEIELAEMEREKIQQQELNAKIQKRNRKNLLQYSGIAVLLLIIAAIVLLLGFVKVSPSVASAVTFFAFLLFFEFMLVLLDPIIDKYSGGEPAYKLMFNAAVALCIFPLHAYFERLLKKKLTK